MDEVIASAGFKARIGAKAKDIGYIENKSSTIVAGVESHVVICLNDQGGAVMNVTEKAAATLRAQDHGHPPVICLQANGIDRCDTAGCNGCGFSEGGVAYTLNTIDRHAVCYAIFKLKDDGNPHNGCHKTDVSCTLDLNGANPNCEQGGC